jgi:hypothetical protein
MTFRLLPTSTQHAWLRRVSDYHSGDVNESERAAVEAHLATCAECRAALALYRRFYELAATPSRLGSPSPVGIAERPRQLTKGQPSSAQVSTWWRPPHDPRRSRALGTAAVVAAVLLVAGFLALFVPRLSSRRPQPATTPTLTPSAITPTPLPTLDVTKLPKPGTGYVAAGPSWAQYVVVAPGAPSTLYSCGVPHPRRSDELGSLLSVAVSTDGGRSWQTRPTQVVGRNCTVSVDPTDARHLLLEATDYHAISDTVTYGPTHLYLSRDTALSWVEQAAPAGVNGAAWDIDPPAVWIGTSVFHLSSAGLARSRDGSPFALVPKAPFSGPNQDWGGQCSGAGGQVRGLFAAGAALYAPFTLPACGLQYARLDTETDKWTAVQMIHGGDTPKDKTIDLVAVSADGRTLLGQNSFFPPLSRSRDGGATWEDLPAVPGLPVCCGYLGRSSSAAIAIADDGAIYAHFFDGDGHGYLLELEPGASGWRYIAPGPANGVIVAFVWGDGGRLAAIWGGPGLSDSTPGLAVLRM